MIGSFQRFVVRLAGKRPVSLRKKAVGFPLTPATAPSNISLREFRCRSVSCLAYGSTLADGWDGCVQRRGVQFP